MYTRFINITTCEDMGREFRTDPKPLEKMVNLIIGYLYYMFARKLKSEHVLDRYADDLPYFVERIKQRIINPGAVDAASYVFGDDFDIFGFLDGCLKRGS